MLSKPDAGWTDFSLGGKTYYLSYLNDIPFMWLYHAIHGLETMFPFVVHGVCEPGRVLCLVSYWNCHVIFEDDSRQELNPAETQWEFAHVNMLDSVKHCMQISLKIWMHGVNGSIYLRRRKGNTTK